MNDLVITSPANSRLKAVAALRRRRIRDEQGRTLLEGMEELALAVDAGVVPEVLLYCPELMHDTDEPGHLLAQVRHLGVETVQLGRAAFEKVAYREGPDGFLAVAPAVGGPCADLELQDADPLLLVCQGVEKPGNLGAMLRTADAAGAHGVIAADPVTDWGNPNLVRASKGTVFSVPVAADPVADVVQWARSRGIRLVVTTPDTETVHTDVDYTGPVAVVVGSEKYGVDDAMLEAADHRVRIPMVGRANSLNVAASAAIVMYEAVRQRGVSTSHA